MNTLRNYIAVDRLVLRGEFETSGIAIPMHRHLPGQSHVTKVLEGAVRVFGDGWEVIARKGEQIELDGDRETHQVDVIEPRTVFENVPYNPSELSMEEMNEVATLPPREVKQPEPRSGRGPVGYVVSSNFVVDESGELVVVAIAEGKWPMLNAALTVGESHGDTLFLDFSCDLTELEETSYRMKARIALPIEPWREIIIRWGKGTTVLETSK